MLAFACSSKLILLIRYISGVYIMKKIVLNILLISLLTIAGCGSNKDDADTVSATTESSMENELLHC